MNMGHKSDDVPPIGIRYQTVWNTHAIYRSFQNALCSRARLGRSCTRTLFALWNLSIDGSRKVDQTLRFFHFFPHPPRRNSSPQQNPHPFFQIKPNPKIAVLPQITI